MDARIIAAHMVTPYHQQDMGGKNDANDAAAICEAAPRPTMRYVAAKTDDQQSMLSKHRLREGYKADRTACVNRIRGLLQGAKSAVMTAHRREDPNYRWVHQLREKSGWQKAAVALANKNVRILWAVFTKDKTFDSGDIS